MSFAWVYGQERAVDVLKGALGSGRVANGYLFSGPPGVGKHHTARQFVKALNCVEEGTDACDDCPNCRLIDKGKFPDFFVPAPQGRRIIKGTSATDRGGDHLVGIVSRLHYRPVMGRYKAVILDPADWLTEEAGNMLLKILEEPPPVTLFILVTTLETSVLPTLVSRCQRLRFPPLKLEEVRRYLEERAGIPSQLAGELASASFGSIERALELNESNILAQKSEIIDYLLSLFESPLPERVTRSMRLLKNIAGNERSAVAKVAAVAGMLARDLLSAACGLDDEQLMFRDRGPAVRTLARRVKRKGALEFASLAREMNEGLRHNENPRSMLHYVGNKVSALGGPPGKTLTGATSDAG